jgi:hypothetical protein
MKPNIDLGDEVKDRITGFSGIVTAIEIYRTGVTRANVQPQELRDGKPIEPHDFDFEDLTILTKYKIPAIPLTYTGKIEMGDEVETRSGYRGVVEEVRTSLSGCTQFGVWAEKLGKDGMPQKGMLFHSGEVELIHKAKVAHVAKAAGTGPAPIGRRAR